MCESLCDGDVTHQTRTFRVTPSEDNTRQTLEKTEGQSLLGTPGSHFESSLCRLTVVFVYSRNTTVF